MVLHQPPLDRFVHIVPRAGVDQEEDGGQDDGKCEHKREDSCPVLVGNGELVDGNLLQQQPVNAPAEP